MKKTERRTPYVNVGVTPHARTALKAAAVLCTPLAGRQVSMSEALIALATVAAGHPDELRRALVISPDDAAE